MGEGVELKEDFAYDAHLARLLIQAGMVKFNGGLGDELEQSVGIVAPHERVGLLHESVSEQGCDARCALSRHGGVIHLGEGVAVEDGGGDDVGIFRPWHGEALLLVSSFCVGGYTQRDEGHVLKSVGHHGALDESGIAGGATLSARLCHDDGGVREVVFPRLECLHYIAHDESGGIAYLVVGIGESLACTLVVAHGQHFHIVSHEIEQRGDDGGEVVGHVGGKDLALGIGISEDARGLEGYRPVLVVVVACL